MPANRNKKLYRTGFTLIELLVVIAIIGFLAATVLASLNSARAKARDSHRISAFKEFEKALELYYDTYGVYPCGDSNMSADPNDGTGDSSASEPFLDGTDGDASVNCNTASGPAFGLFTAGMFNSRFSIDPINDEDVSGYLYRYDVSSDRQKYLLYLKFETGTERMSNDGGLCNNVYEVGAGLGSMSPLMGQFHEPCN